MKNKQISLVRTDLALEAAEPFKNENNLPYGVTVDEDYDEINEIRVTIVEVILEQKSLASPSGNTLQLKPRTWMNRMMGIIRKLQKF